MKNSNLKLAALEARVLESLINNLYAEAGYSDVDGHDIAREINVDIKSVRGALSSLVKKQIVGISANDSGYQIIYLSSDYWYLHPQWSKEIAE